jgi:hypothetical protein
MTRADSKSPSFIAATLAASRSASPSPNPPGQQPHVNAINKAAITTWRARQGSLGAHSEASSVTDLDLTDTSSIPPTTKLISMFEKGNEGDLDPVKKEQEPSPSAKRLGNKPKLRPITPPRSLSPVLKNDEFPLPPVSPSFKKSVERQRPTSLKTVASPRRLPEQKRQLGPISPRQVLGMKPPTPPPARSTRPTKPETLPILESPKVRRKEKPRTPPTKTVSRANTVLHSPQPQRPVSGEHILAAGPQVGIVKPPDVKPRRQSKPKPLRANLMEPVAKNDRPNSDPPRRLRRSSSTSSTDSFVSASSTRSPEPLTPPQLPRPQASTRSIIRPSLVPKQHSGPARSMNIISSQGLSSRVPSSQSIRQLPNRQPTPNIPFNQLTSAIMAGSLASARGTPSSLTSKTPPPRPPSRRQTPHMLTTLRKPVSKSDDEETRSKQHRKKPLSKKHAHHEGARRRWREEITARERKRYEGVWASNRGLFTRRNTLIPSQTGSTTAISAENQVANVVVRDIWSRSRLPSDELAEVWDLVDLHGNGVLGRTEFVVGMWLIDQRLRGRKIPAKVSDSVWGSAKGIRVLGPKGKR